MFGLQCRIHSHKTQIRQVSRFAHCVWAPARKAHLGEHSPRIQVLQEYLLGVNQLLWSEGAADILKSLLFSLAAKLDILIQICPLAQDALQVAGPRGAHHLKNKYRVWWKLTRKTTLHLNIFYLFMCCVRWACCTGRWCARSHLKIKCRVGLSLQLP